MGKNHRIHPALKLRDLHYEFVVGHVKPFIPLLCSVLPEHLPRCFQNSFHSDISDHTRVAS